MDLANYKQAKQLYQESLGICEQIGFQEGSVNARIGLGRVATRLGKHKISRQHFRQALSQAIEFQAIPKVLDILVGLIELLIMEADKKRQEQATELYTLVLRSPHIANSRWFKETIGRHITTVVATLPPDIVSKALKRGNTRDLEATVMELLTELAPRHNSEGENSSTQAQH